MRILITAPYFQPVVEQYRRLFDARGCELVIPPVRERLSEDELLPLVGDIVGVICGDDQWTERVLMAAPKLKVLSKWGTGIDSIDQDAAARLGIAVRNTPGAFNEPVADQVMGYILSFARRVLWIMERMRNGGWSKQPCVSLQGRTLSVIGVGNTGKAVVRRAKAFEMRLLGNDIVDMPPEFIAETGIRMVNKQTLLSESDFVSLNCTLNPTSFHIIGASELALMKRTAVLVNCARGPLVDEPELAKALENKTIAGAGLDVFEVEPLPSNSPFLKMDNVMLAPHNSNSSPAAWERAHWNTIRNLLEGLSIPSTDLDTLRVII